MFKIAIVADLHHFSRTLSDSGKAYQLRSGSDQKCLEETGAIITSAFETIGNSDCDAVLIAGDLSNDGEKVSHAEVRDMIASLAEKKPVYVVYATHDWCCDGNAKRFEGDKYYNDVETMTPPELREFYKDYGVKQSDSEYVTHIGSSSYALDLGENIRFLGINDDKNGKGASGYTDEHFDWILNQVKTAKAQGKTVILMQHHLLLTNISPLINKGQIIGDHDERAEALASAGADFVIVGHSHTQRTTCYKAKNGNLLTQINIGSLCGHPAPITTLTVDEKEYRIDVSHFEKFTFDGVEYSSDYITEHTKGLIMNIFNAAMYDKEYFFDILEGSGIKSDAIVTLYPVIKKLVSRIMNMTVGTAGHIINGMTFGKGIRKDALKQIKDDNLMEHIMDIVMNVFDGSLHKYRVTDPVYIVVRDVASLPIRFSKTFKIKALQKDSVQKILKEIPAIAEELTNPSLPDNQHCVIPKLNHA